ncbi:ABC transporter family substrate-binding protein [Corynebacterium freiburgense]|uniref:ABC transporter family substrate-binding protein n=1 Tax=Corynebacterium freiburgense TaxID=556548 RepID=UPI000552D351|nr:ABC transporter family substrate-binding protein [Corynebacterium freiburgense]WJZ02261.1 putative monoacyl phosphatidylinositol tetramannoside-binding protein LpqW precursor [Corynebacterium freiburgense]
MNRLPFVSLLACIMLAGCAASPGPPPVAEPGEEQKQAAEPKNNTANTLEIGIDPIKNGLNPHLVSDDSAFVQSLASLVLPSTFVQGEMDTAVLEKAEEVPVTEPGVAQSVRYIIRKEAQWSDGTPITGADFRYLWRNMVTTPGVIDPAGYESVMQIRTSNSGKTVDVDFRRKVADWKLLFNNLVPSHLFGTGTDSFDQVLEDVVPASAGRYMVRTVDRNRGVVTLTRNDRYWGKKPAVTETLIFREIRSANQGRQMVRSGQVGFLDVTPSEVGVSVFELMPKTQLRIFQRESRLELTFNASTLNTPELRRGVAKQIDAKLIAEIAAGRRTELAVPDFTPSMGAEELPKRVRIAADPADDAAASAAASIVDMLRGKDMNAEVVLSDFEEITGRLLPEGRVDAVVSWQRTTQSSITSASRYMCLPTAERAGNLAGACDHDFDKELLSALASGKYIDGSNFYSQQVLGIPLIEDTRIEVLGVGIVGPNPALEQWPMHQPAGALATAATWRRSDE